MKLAALCCTYLRPQTLGQVIECFLRQDYPAKDRELVILDDAGQYETQAGDRWRLISVPYRFRSLGQKRNACAALASPDVEGFLVADDDDIYLPHWFSAQAEALRQAEWSRPSLVLVDHEDGFKEIDACGLYHGGWAFRAETFSRVLGYGAHNNGEDQELADRLTKAGVSECDPCRFADPFYVYRHDNNSYHLSYMDDQGYLELENRKVDKVAKINVGWPTDFGQLPVVRRFVFGPHVNPVESQMPVELIGPVNAPGKNGPTNGMYALQKEFRKRMDNGLDWLSIKSLPASSNAVAWFWNWADRRYAGWWDSQGKPFVQGPNMLFTHSANPRIDKEECALLDAANCRAMFCHSFWYKELIEKHKGPRNKSQVFMWPYPIEPWPGEPLPDKYDLLIYAKNGHRPGLLEYLAEVFSRHVQIHYGQYQREELFEAARRSRACAYLADDDHGPLALQEILLAGCPVVGVRTGAPFVDHGSTGFLVDRLPPGLNCVQSATEEAQVQRYMNAVELVQSFDRRDVRQLAINQFSTTSTINIVIQAIQFVRRCYK